MILHGGFGLLNCCATTAIGCQVSLSIFGRSKNFLLALPVTQYERRIRYISTTKIQRIEKNQKRLKRGSVSGIKQWPPKLREGALPFSFVDRMAAKDPTLKPIVQSTNFLKKQNFDYFLVIDFEATCDSSTQPDPQEIIEFPCLKVNGQTFEIESKFHHYVRPTVHPVLTQFCTDLTGILQMMVEEEPDFGQVFGLFRDWLITEKLLSREDEQGQGEHSNWRQFAFVTCGDWDLKKMLPAQMSLWNIAPPWYFGRWINIKKSFHKEMGTFPRGMMTMLASLDIAHTGRHHSGIDDCINIAQILKHLALTGALFDTNSSALD